jgi:hypothetical protein
MGESLATSGEEEKPDCSLN